MPDKQPAPPWNAAAVRTWLDRRIAAARAEQIAAERAGYGQRDECDKAAAEEMVCTMVKGDRSTEQQATFLQELRSLLDRDDYLWRGVYDDTRFDRHVRAYVRKLTKMAKANEGFERLGRYQ